MGNTQKFSIAAILLAVGLAGLIAANRVLPVRAAGAADVNPLPGTATLMGMVEAPKAFKAAQVYAMNVDKNILFMVYTSGGRFRAANLFPGRYEVSVRKRGFASDPQKVVLKAGAQETLNFSLRETAPEEMMAGQYGGPNQRREEVARVSYDELYPPGPGHDQVQRTCVTCHGFNFLPGRPWDEKQWSAAIDMMMDGKSERGAMITPDMLGAADREAVVGYLTKNFGPNSTRRALKIDVEFPLDEDAVSKAMYIEYYLPLDPKLDASNKQRRAQEPHFDKNGNVWYTDRSIPNRVGRLDPRTGDIKDYVLPDPKADPHGLTVDADGQVWWAETTGFHLGRLDPKTGEMTRYEMDSTGKEKGRGHTPVTDSKQNIWFTVIAGDMIGKWDRKTQKTTLWKVPRTPPATVAPYGILVDKNDKVWFAELRGCKVVLFDPGTEKFKEYGSPSSPCAIRRLGLDSKGTIWYGVFSSGKLGKIDPKTGKIVEYKIPMPYSAPYDTWADANDNIWISDGGQGGALIKFDPRTEKFTYYPTPQVTDQPKLAITRDGAIWYNPRSSSKAAAGVLYPDVTKMNTLAAYY